METKVILQRNIENDLYNFGVVPEDDHTLAPSPIASIENQQDQLTGDSFFFQTQLYYMQSSFCDTS